MNAFRDLIQDFRIADAATTAESVRNKSAHLENELGRLKRQVQRLQLVCEAMWELLREEHNLEDQQLADRIQQVAKSQELNSRRTVVCTSCQRENASTIQKCLYCGELLSDANMFQ